MVFKRFETRLAIQIAVLALTIFLCTIIMVKTTYYYTGALLLILSFFECLWIYSYIGKTAKKLTSFFEAIKYSEYNYKFSAEDQGPTFSQLNKILDEIVSQFRTIKQSKEEQYFFYHTVIQHIALSLIAIKPDGEIIMSNNSANRLFGFNNLKHIDQFKEIDIQLFNSIQKLEDGQKQLVKTQMNDEIFYLSVHTKIIKQETGIIKVVSIQNIQTELEEQEIDSWQKLIRVLTHEIMNSITPVTSLTDTLKTMLQPDTVLDNENIDDIRLAINTIHKRSSGLLHFVETYRNLTKIPQPKFDRIEVCTFLGELKKLFEKDIRSSNIDFQVEISDTNLEITADESMMERVLINLIKNAIQAVSETEFPKISVFAYQNSTGNIVIQVIDNGQGILPEVLDKIFIPFFTTRPGGSGIGLALSRQLIRAQGGTISAVSRPGQTTFTIKL